MKSVSLHTSSTSQIVVVQIRWLKLVIEVVCQFHWEKLLKK